MDLPKIKQKRGDNIFRKTILVSYKIKYAVGENRRKKGEIFSILINYAPVSPQYADILFFSQKSYICSVFILPFCLFRRYFKIFFLYRGAPKVAITICEKIIPLSI